ncbi:SurA N-terminal domain-containing protein [Paracoccus sp. 11-3]|uniref:SurA N-terminal domain-containing protein n=1 Tax=Paracoccus amoyensis TaxID=2760093 RepID=A0A926GAI5_9RHOB|nr:SurA N-terminal domain-containing protein [Paracoccus amoyensis]
MRTHGKSTIVWLLLGLMVLGLGGFGVTSFSGGSSSVGSVGETPVTADQYLRALRNQMQSYQQQTGQPLSMAQAQAIGLPQAVQSQLFTAAALEEQTRKIGISVGDEKVRQSILEAPAFRGPNGRFDRTAYGEVLRRERMTEAEFESAIRVDESRMLLQRAIVGGVVAPQPLVDTTVHWLLERRDIAWRELTADQLQAPIADPDEETLKAWHSANADRFTAPEIRKISYVWLTPEMLAPEVQLDEAALRAAYDAKAAEYQQPERRMVSRLVMPSQDEALAAKARIDAGEISFEDLVTQRGLTLEDVDLGEASKDSLGDAGEPIFELEQPGVVGPIQTNLGPTLFAMHAILDPVDVSFEDAEEELRSDAAMDRAVRMIEDRSHDYEDLLVGGATLEEVADQTELELGQIEWSADSASEGGSIAGYQAFRDLANALTQTDFPTITQLDDGGVFAVRLDEIVPPMLKPFEDVREDVLEDWRRGEAHRQLLALAEEERLQDTAAAAPQPEPAASTGAGGVVENPAVTPDAAPVAEPAASASAWVEVPELTRDGWVEGVPPDVVARAFEMDAPGEVEVVDAQDRVILLRLDAINEADLEGEDAQRVDEAVRSRIGESLSMDIFDYYARAAQRSGGLEINQSAINAVNTQVQ